MHIQVNQELKAYIDPLTPDEFEALARSLLAEGCRDALVLWGDLRTNSSWRSNARVSLAESRQMPRTRRTLLHWLANSRPAPQGEGAGG